MLGLGIRDQGRAPLGGRFVWAVAGVSNFLARKIATATSSSSPAAKLPRTSIEVCASPVLFPVSLPSDEDEF